MKKGKKEKLEKVSKMFKNLDFSRLIQDLYTVDGFTEDVIVSAIKSQNKGASIHINGAFYREVIEPLTLKLKEAGLLTVRKVGQTRFYTISDRQKAIELFKKPERKFSDNLQPLLPAPIPARLALPKPVETTEEVKKAEEELKPMSKENLNIAFMLTPKNTYGFKTRLLGMIVIFGCMYREKTQRISSSEPKKTLMAYLNSSGQHFDKIVAEFNTAARKLEMPFIIKKYGNRRAQKFQIDVSPRRALKFLKEVGEIYFSEDDEINNFLSWSLGKTQDLGTKPKDTTEEPKPKKVKNKEDKTSSTLPEPAVVKEKKPEVKTEDTESKLWVITKMSLSEFKERYSVEAVELMTKDDQTLIEAEVKSQETIDIIKSELRRGEKCHS